ncbi:MAG: nuclear transport factor 2 family protein [Fluviicola sp.]|nr:nuclear transport factor 2 family protein [Fluviicola sp.]
MKAIITQFYTAFSELNPEKMTSSYHKDVVFEDPAFGQLEGKRASNMWRMLCESQKEKNFIVTFSDIQSDDNTGSAYWEAKYEFSKTGRKVHNKIIAQFEFKDGLIIKHTDDFNLHSWAKQALGFKGYLFGRTSFFKKKLQKQTNSLLDRFENSLK